MAAVVEAVAASPSSPSSAAVAVAAGVAGVAGVVEAVVGPVGAVGMGVDVDVGLGGRRVVVCELGARVVVLLGGVGILWPSALWFRLGYRCFTW